MQTVDLEKVIQNLQKELQEYPSIAPEDGVMERFQKRVITKLVQNVIEWLQKQPVVDAIEVKSNVGDLVYALWGAPVKTKYIIYCAEVKEIRVSVRSCRLTTTYILEPIDYRGHRKEYRDEDFGTLVFKDEADAERKLFLCERCLSGSCNGCSFAERKTEDEKQNDR